MKKIALALACLVISYNVNAAIDDNSIGISGQWEQSPYIGVSTEFSPMPLINFDSKYIFISGTASGVHLWKQNNQQLDATLDYQSLDLKPSDSDYIRIKQLDRRKSTLLSGLAYSITTDYGQFEADINADILNNSNTVSIELSYTAYLQLTDKLAIIPEFGITWFNGKHNRYYYGVSKQESIRTGLAEYRPSDSVNPYLSFTATYEIMDKWSAVMEYDFNLLAHQVKSSPIVDRSNISSITAGIMYSF